MLEKKDVVQKSFRIHRQNDIWLSLLSLKLGRTQNELVNVAIKMLLDDNKRWFLESFIEATFRESIDDDGIQVKKRLADTEIELIPFYLSGENVALINVTLYSDEVSDTIVKTDCKKVNFGPGYRARLLEELINIIEITYDKYPQIMKNFSTGSFLEE